MSAFPPHMDVLQQWFPLTVIIMQIFSDQLCNANIVAQMVEL